MSELAQPASATLTGYVEAITDTAALGWVWRPGHADRVVVTLRRGEQTIATTAADGMRSDLAQNGIGDGRHAFSLPIPPEWQGRAAELRVFALDLDGQGVPLDIPAPANGPAAPAQAPLQRGIDALIASQRVIHRNLQAALTQKNDAPTGLLADLERAQARLADNIGTVELFCVRIEQALAGSGAGRDPRMATSKLLAATMALSGLSFLLSAIALGWVLARG